MVVVRVEVVLELDVVVIEELELELELELDVDVVVVDRVCVELELEVELELDEVVDVEVVVVVRVVVGVVDAVEIAEDDAEEVAVEMSVELTVEDAVELYDVDGTVTIVDVAVVDTVLTVQSRNSPLSYARMSSESTAAVSEHIETGSVKKPGAAQPNSATDVPVKVTSWDSAYDRVEAPTLHASSELPRNAPRPLMASHFKLKAVAGKQSVAIPRKASSSRLQCETGMVITLLAPSGTHTNLASNSVVAVVEPVVLMVDDAEDVEDDVTVDVRVVDGLVTLQLASSWVAEYVMTLFNPAIVSLAHAATGS